MVVCVFAQSPGRLGSIPALNRYNLARRRIQLESLNQLTRSQKNGVKNNWLEIRLMVMGRRRLAALPPTRGVNPSAPVRFAAASLKFLQVGGGGFVAFFRRSQSQPAHLVEIPIGAFAVAEFDLAADHRAGPGDLVHGEADFAGGQIARRGNLAGFCGGRGGDAGGGGGGGGSLGINLRSSTSSRTSR